MAFSGFGKDSGPNSASALASTPFGHFPRPPSPSPSTRVPEAVETVSSRSWPFPHSRPFVRPFQSTGAQRGLEAVDRVPSPPLAFQNTRPSMRPHQSVEVRRGPEAVERVLSPPLAFENSIPAVRAYQPTGVQRRPEAPQRLQSVPFTVDRIHSAASPPYSSVGLHRPVQSPPRWVDGQGSSIKDFDAKSHEGTSAVTSFVASRNSATSVTARVARFQDLKKTRSPPSWSIDGDVSRNLTQTLPQRPSLSFAQNNRAKLPGSHSNFLAHQDLSSVSPYISAYDSERSLSHEVTDVEAPKRSMSPPVQSMNEVFQDNQKFAQNYSERPLAFPPRFNTRSNVLLSNSDSQVPEGSLPSAGNFVAAPTRPNSFSVPKRTRSPPLLSTEEISKGNIGSSQDETERDTQAKAKRLTRFKNELSETVPLSLTDTSDKKFSANRYQQSLVERQTFAGQHSTESTKKIPNGYGVSDYEGLETSTVIIGLCPDMCPESERGERERKGDLDQYERLEGDRNQTNKYLAVKKYTRTAEREANLIRPMPILQKTIDYLLNLLDQPYDDRFLSMYNFLWDRMRAIRRSSLSIESFENAVQRTKSSRNNFPSLIRRCERQQKETHAFNHLHALQREREREEEEEEEMSDHLVLYVDRLVRPVAVHPVHEEADKPSTEIAGPSSSAVVDKEEETGTDVSREEEPLVQAAECRICQEEDSIKNLETPCACSGSLKYAHRKCVQHWCNEKGDIICEICHQPYQPGYTAPPPPRPEETAIDIGGGWTISGTPMDLRDPRLLAIAEAERQFLEAEYDDYAASNASGAAFCRSAALILMALLLLRHALTVTDADGEDDVSAFFSLFLLRAAGFLLPCYIMAWAISILQRRRQRQEAAALAATQVAFVLQSGQRRGVHFTIASGPSVTAHQEIV